MLRKEERKEVKKLYIVIQKLKVRAKSEVFLYLIITI
jgi:hypothetical protein